MSLGSGGGRGSVIAFEGKILEIRDGRLKALVFIKQLTVESQVCMDI